MANISGYDAKVYFWGMVLFATVSFIALPTIAFIYFENRVLMEQMKQDRRETKELKRLIKEKLKEDE